MESYHCLFFDDAGNELVAASVAVIPHNRPICDDFVFPTRAPTSAPTVKIEGHIRGERAVNLGPSRGRRPQVQLGHDSHKNTEITLKEVECLTWRFLFDLRLDRT